MEPKDFELEERLKRLLSPIESHNATQNNLTDSHLSQRLAIIKASGKNITQEEIESRLSNIKEKKNIPSENELMERLAKLMGTSTASATLNSNVDTNVLINKKLSDVEQVNDLLKQLRSESKIDTSNNDVTKGDSKNISQTLPKNTAFSSSTIGSLKNETLAYVDKLVAESNLTPYYVESASNEEDSSDDSEEMCGICSETASLICSGCHSDRYCKNCYAEFHTPSDTEDDHISEPFVKNKKTRETAL